MNNQSDTELNELAVLVGRLQRGELARPEFRGHSVHYGVYTQRQPDRYFVRLRVPLGELSVVQLTALADTAERWADGECHLTTRQGVEIHNLSLEGVLEALAALADVGLSSHESGGNTVRGIIACSHGGAEGEPFDVTEYAALVNGHFLRHPAFQSLPRKIKIGFSCCAEDCTHSMLQDLGFQARANASGEIGFRVMVGGGAGALPRFARELLGFLPANDLLIFIEAFLRMFNRLGDRQNRRRARVKFLVEALGLDRLRDEVLREWDALKTAGRKWPSVEPAGRTARPAARCSVRVALRGGNITSGQLRRLGKLCEEHPVTLRITPEQEFLIDAGSAELLPSIEAALCEVGLLPKNPALRLAACPGSSPCSNAFTNSRLLAEAISAKLSDQEVTGPMRIRVSGCTNGCALHVIADIGLEGLAQRRQTAQIPAYRIWLGGRPHQERPRLASELGVVPARRVPDCVAALARLYHRERRSGESLTAVMERIGVEPFTALVRKHQAPDELGELITDLGEQQPYRTRAEAPATTC